MPFSWGHFLARAHKHSEAVSDPALDERRNGPDRRKSPTSLWDSVVGIGRRRHVRRESERCRPHYVDYFPAVTFIWILLLLMFTVVDGLLTLELLEVGYHEFNPLMHYFLSKGPAWFVIGKYVLTAAGLPILVVFGTHTRLKHVLPFLASLYALLVAYQLVLLFR